MAGEDLVVLSAKVDRVLKQRIRDEANARNTTVSRLIAEALESHLDGGNSLLDRFDALEKKLTSYLLDGDG